MNAHKFVAEKGVEEAKLVLRSAYMHCVYVETPTHFDIEESVLVHENDLKEICEPYVDLKELKQVVESVEIVQRSGGFESVKAAITNYRASGDMVTFLSLEKRLADCELIEFYKGGKND